MCEVESQCWQQFKNVNVQSRLTINWFNSKLSEMCKDKLNECGSTVNYLDSHRKEGSAVTFSGAHCYSESLAVHAPLLTRALCRRWQTLFMMKRSFDNIFISATTCRGSSSTPGTIKPSESVCWFCLCQPPLGYCTSRPQHRERRWPSEIHETSTVWCNRCWRTRAFTG